MLGRAFAESVAGKLRLEFLMGDLTLVDQESPEE
jgi:hypothetical protein